MIKVKEKLKDLQVLRQSLPVIQSLLDTGSSTDLVLRLIEGSNEKIDNNSGLKLVKIYKEKIKEYQIRNKKKMEEECLTLID